MNELFEALGFRWESETTASALPSYSVERACFRFHKMLPEFVWDAGVLEGNPFTFPEVQTLLDGVTVGGRALSDQEQILNLAAASKQLLYLVRRGSFSLNKAIFCELHSLVARNEALEWGLFRGEGQQLDYSPRVSLGEGRYYEPLPTVAGAEQLNHVFSEGLAALEHAQISPIERALAFFLFGALQQFFFDGNRRTSRFMMNGALMAAGIDAIGVPAAKRHEFNRLMVDFFLSREASAMFAFLLSCHPERSGEFGERWYGHVCVAARRRSPQAQGASADGGQGMGRY